MISFVVFQSMKMNSNFVSKFGKVENVGVLGKWEKVKLLFKYLFKNINVLYGIKRIWHAMYLIRTSHI